MKNKFDLRIELVIIKQIMSDNTQLTPAKGYNTTRMGFSEPISGSIPNSTPKIEFKRINITTKNEDGSFGELIIPTERLFSFGVSENTSQETGKVNGYTFPLCLWGRDGATEAEKVWTETFEKIVDKCIGHLIDNREVIDMFELTRSDLTKSKGGLNPLYWKKEKFTNEKGKTVLRPVPGTGPTLYTKLIFSKKTGKFLSQFFDQNDEPLNAMDLMGKYCYSQAAIKIESIFIGSKISLQVKLYESVVEPTSTGMKRLLARPKARSKVLEHKACSSATPMDDDDDDYDDDTGSIGGSDDDDDVTDKPKEKVESVVKKKVVRKVRKVVRKP
jgi:hypothetical protein